jgi:hypothetical protein
MTRRFSCAILFLVLSTSFAAFGFDIAIYKDPLSYFNGWFLNNCRDTFWTGTRQGDSTDIFTHYYNSGQMDDVYGWYRDMGINYVMGIYPYETNFYEIPTDTGMNIKVMNWYYPGQPGMQGEKYVDAQYRDVVA